MRKFVVLVALIVAVGLAVPAFAGDIIAMPTGNMMSAQTVELNYIRWQNFAGPNDANIYEAFVGVTDWFELDVLHFDPVQDLPGGSDTEVNAYLRLIKESPKHPSLIVGATNILGENWLGTDDAAAFVVGAYNISCPAGAPTFNDPLVRMHLGWGDKFHGDRWFGGIQMLVTPRLGLAAFNYQGEPSYLGVYTVSKTLELRGGWKNGTPFYSAGLDFAF